MLGTYIPAGEGAYKFAPPALLASLAYNCDRFDIDERMTYELIIDVNTAEFLRTGLMRVYSQEEETAKHERDFYAGHYFAEPHMKAAAFNVKAMMDRPAEVNKAKILAPAVNGVIRYAQHLRQYGQLPTDGFSYFRQFLDTYPDGKRNASGAFMPSPQLLEPLLHKPSAEYQVFLRESHDYFPHWSQQMIKDWIRASLDGINVADFITAGKLEMDEEATKYMRMVVRNLIVSRHSHIGITHKHIPVAFPEKPVIKLSELKDFGEHNIMDEGALRGTAGFNVQHVLGNSVFRLTQLYEQLGGEGKDLRGQLDAEL